MSARKLKSRLNNEVKLQNKQKSSLNVSGSLPAPPSKAGQSVAELLSKYRAADPRYSKKNKYSASTPTMTPAERLALFALEEEKQIRERLIQNARRAMTPGPAPPKSWNLLKEICALNRNNSVDTDEHGQPFAEGQVPSLTYLASRAVAKLLPSAPKATLQTIQWIPNSLRLLILRIGAKRFNSVTDRTLPYLLVYDEGIRSLDVSFASITNEGLLSALPKYTNTDWLESDRRDSWEEIADRDALLEEQEQQVLRYGEDRVAVAPAATATAPAAATAASALLFQRLSMPVVHIQYLDLSFCTQLQGGQRFIVALGRALPALEFLSVAGCFDGQSGPLSFAAMAFTMGNLVALNLSKNYWFSELEVELITSNEHVLPRLRVLNLSSCPLVTARHREKLTAARVMNVIV